MALASIETTLWSPTTLGTGLFVLVAFLVNTLLLWRKSSHKVFDLFNGAVVGEAGSPDFRTALQSGYEQYYLKGKPFKLPSAHHPMVVLPLKYLNEIKSLPDSKLSFEGEVFDRFLGQHTGLSFDNTTLVPSVKVDLTRHISKTINILREEMEFAAAQNIGPCNDWTPLQIYPRLSRITALISGRIFVGVPLSRDEEWINISVNYTVDVMNCAYKFWTYPSWQRPFVAPFLPEARAAKKHRDNAIRLLTPVVRKRLEEMKDPEFEKPSDMVQWAIDNSGDRAADLQVQTKTQLMASVAAIHTTTVTIFNVLLDLASYPEYTSHLREEISQTLAADSNNLTKTSMTKLRKLDSFIKESQRMNPTGLVQMNRRVSSDITLSDGITIPKGLFTAFPSHNINMDSSLWENPQQFDGFRFEKLRGKEGNENKFQFVTTGTDSINFGHGSHACPGRFFASNEIKIILLCVLMNYDLKLLDGEKRPESIYRQTTISPNPDAKLLFRRREH
jgi:cytochrome P450